MTGISAAFLDILFLTDLIYYDRIINCWLLNFFVFVFVFVRFNDRDIVDLLQWVRIVEWLNSVSLNL